MTTKIITPTSKGQVTLPKNWRDKFKTDNYSLEVHESALIIKPVVIEQLDDEEVIFDAERDNQGKGISTSQMIKMLKKINNG